MPALYPTSITTQLFKVIARTQTTLTADVTAGVTTWPVVTTSGWEDKGFVVCENETVYYSAKTATSLTVQRGFAGTAVSHVSGKAVKLAVVAETINRITDELVATQTHVGISGSAVTGSLDYRVRNLPSQGVSTQVTNLNAQYLGGSSLGQLQNPSKLSSVNGVSILPNNIEILPSAWSINNDNPASLLEIIGTSVTPVIQKLCFGTTDQADFGPIKMPSEYNGGTLTLTYMYCGSTAGITHTLGIKVAKAASGENYNPTYGAAVYLDQLTASGTTGVVKLYTTALAGLSLGLTNSTLNWIRICGGTSSQVQMMNFGISWSRG
uniref:Uncharacterized protein n=1 Tax=viral metagenome TaxID=1070528 RepID=A0A6H1ZCY8_9ZZZZ